MDTLQLLGQALECSVCLEQLDVTSRVLPCQHTFCQKCLLDIINTHKELRCPECRILVTVPFKSLPPNILLMRILEGMKNIPPDPGDAVGDLIQLPSPEKPKQSDNDPFAFLSQVTAFTTTTTTTIGSSINCPGTSFTTPNASLSQRSSWAAFNNPFLPSHCPTSVAGSGQTSLSGPTSQNCSLPQTDVGVTSSVVQSIISTSLVSQPSSNSSRPLVGQTTASSLSFPCENKPLSDSITTIPSSTSSSTSSLSLQTTQSVTSSQTNPTYTIAGALPDTQTSMAPCDTLSEPSPDTHFSTGSSNSLNEMTPRSTESQTPQIRTSIARQNSAKSLKESQASEIGLHTFVAPLNIEARALYNYDGKEARDLVFKKGDLITVCKQIDENWYMGELDGNFGFVPVSYVKVLEGSCSSIPQCKALYDFKMMTKEERSCLMFSKGDTITVLRRIDDNWAEGKLNTHIGIFPLSFVELNEAAKNLIKLSGSVAPNSLHPATTASTKATSFVTPTAVTPPPPSTACLTPQPPPSAAPAGRGENGFHPTSERLSLGDSLTPPPRSLNAPASHSCGPRVTTAAAKAPSTPSNQMKKGGLTSSNADVPRPRSASILTTESHQLYIALFPYKPRKADELELKKGQLYSVGDKCLDGWFKGRDLASDNIGVFPGNYVQLADSQTVAAMFSRHSRVAVGGSGCHVTWSALRSSPAYNYLVQGRPTSAPFASHNAPDVRTASNGTAASPAPPELPPRAATISTKALLPSTHGHNSNLERSSTQESSSRRASSGSLPLPSSGEKKCSSIPRDSSGVVPPNGGGGGISLMRKLGGKKKPKSPPLLSVDNPVFEDNNPNSRNRGRSATSTMLSGKSEKICDVIARSAKQPAPLVRERYRCVVPYPANSGYELELQVGDIVYVHKKREDGWLKGTMQRTGKTGLFPSIFVEVVDI